MTNSEERAVSAIRPILQDEYLRGLEEGLAIAEKICTWIGDVRPPRKYGQEVAKWGRAAIKKAREDCGKHLHSSA